MRGFPVEQVQRDKRIEKIERRARMQPKRFRKPGGIAGTARELRENAKFDSR